MIITKENKHLFLLGLSNAMKTTMPMTEYAKIDCENGYIVVKTTNLHNDIKVIVPVEDNNYNGTHLINAFDLVKAIKTTKENFSLTFNDSNVVLSQGRSKVKLPYINEEIIFPERNGNLMNSITLQSEWFCSNIEKALNFTSKDELRPAMGGVFFECENNTLFVSATDAHILYSNKTDFESENFSCILDKGCKSVLMLGELSYEIKADIYENYVKFYTPDGVVEISVGKLEYRIPPYKQVIPKEPKLSINMNFADLQNAVRTVVPFSNPNSKMLKISGVTDGVVLECEDIDLSSSAKSFIECTPQEEFVIGVNGYLLLSVLNCIKSSDVCFNFWDAKRAMTFSDGTECTYLIMPLMLNY